MKFTELQKLAKEALPTLIYPENGQVLEYPDEGSERQIDAQNLFYEEAQRFLPAKEFEKVESFANAKSTLEEGISFAMEAAAKETLRLENLTFNASGVNWNCYLTANDGQDLIAARIAARSRAIPPSRWLEEWVDERPEVVAAFDCLAHGETFPDENA